MRRARLIGTVLVAVLVLAGCGSLTPVTEQGRDIQDLYNLLFVVAAVIFVLVEGAIVFAVVRYRRRGDMLPPQFHGNNLLEVVWTVVPLLIVAALFVLTWGVLARVDARADNPRVTVNVVGFQWQWQFTYQGERLDLPAGQPAEDLTIKGTIAKPPVMYLPVGEPIRFNTEAQDVIHSFYVREFLFKRDAFPGHLNTFDLTITKPGDFGGQCTEYCGLAHQAMRFTIRAVSRPQFEAWLVKTKKEAEEFISVGDAGVIESRTMEFPNGRIVSRSIDDRIGAFVVLEALSRYAYKPGAAKVVAVATTQEEIGYRGGGAGVDDTAILDDRRTRSKWRSPARRQSYSAGGSVAVEGCSSRCQRPLRRSPSATPAWARGASHRKAARGTDPDGARRRLRRHRHEPALCSSSGVRSGVLLRTHPGERLRGAVFDRLGAHRRRRDQVHRLHHARRQSRRRRCARAPRAHSPAGAPHHRPPASRLNL